MVSQFMLKKDFLLHGTYVFFVFVQDFYSILSNIDEVLLINPFANVFVFGDFNIHHKDWLIYYGGTDQPGELCYNFSISENH